MLDNYREYHHIYGHPALDDSKVFKYQYCRIKDNGYIYGYADEGKNVSFWFYNNELKVTGIKCLGELYKRFSDKDKELFLEEVENLAEKFKFFSIN